MLNDAYYELLLEGRSVIDGISVLKLTWLIVFKAKAWLDLQSRLERGEHIDSRDIKKHRNDILTKLLDYKNRIIMSHIGALHHKLPHEHIIYHCTFT